MIYICMYIYMYIYREEERHHRLKAEEQAAELGLSVPIMIHFDLFQIIDLDDT